MERKYTDVKRRASKAITNQAERLVVKYGEIPVWLVLSKHFRARREKRIAEKQKTELEKEIASLKRKYKI